mmetsp:Transcript_18261/g.52093  ORF Transcript_18261/g.52093 Transcript_18261/m.52093 type:complete len:221 (-) Transcript_18261:522-1184(-)
MNREIFNASIVLCRRALSSCDPRIHSFMHAWMHAVHVVVVVNSQTHLLSLHTNGLPVLAHALFLLLLADDRRLLAQRLRRLLPCLLIPDVVPQPGLFVELEKSARRFLAAPLPDDLQCHQRLVQSLAVHVVDLAIFDQLAVSLVAWVVVGATAAPVHHVVFVRFLDLLHRPVVVVLLRFVLVAVLVVRQLIGWGRRSTLLRLGRRFLHARARCCCCCCRR